MARTQHDVLSVEWIKLELIRTAYATRGGVFSTMDPRVVIGWYALYALVPWFTHNLTVLALLFLGGVASIFLARVGPLVLGLFVIGLGLELVYIFVAAWFFGGDASTMVALLELTLKVGTVSLVSMAAFVSLDPEKLSDGLLALKAPELLAFAVSYGYRMLPILIEEFSVVFQGYRLRIAPPERPGLLGWRVGVQWANMAVRAFHPIFLNTAKNVRTTVEALEARGFTFATIDRRGRAIRIGHLRTRPLDWIVLGVTVVFLICAFVIGGTYPIYR